MHVLVIGGGAAGFFAAITAAESNSSHHVTILERGPSVLSKVRISGGGRCNVTHACFDPAVLVTHYPRGSRVLRGPFSQFQPQHTVEWFQSRGVPLKTEPDNRMFPVSDQSESIIQCLQSEVARLGIKVRINAWIQKIQKSSQGTFQCQLGSETLEADRLILATGSSPQGWAWAKAFGHEIIPPVPSLFTFTIKDPRLTGLAGISLPRATISIEGTLLRQTGPILITHEGLSGPAVLKLSAWCARELHRREYHASLSINWTGEQIDPLVERLKKKRMAQAVNLIASDPLPDIPRRLWARLVIAAGIPQMARWTEVGNEAFRSLAAQITAGRYALEGRNAYKDEFVTAGGVALDEVDFRTMQSKRCPGLFFAGEVLDIDGETGGFNFQNAWTTGWIAGRSTLLPTKKEA